MNITYLINHEPVRLATLLISFAISFPSLGQEQVNLENEERLSFLLDKITGKTITEKERLELKKLNLRFKTKESALIFV